MKNSSWVRRVQVIIHRFQRSWFRLESALILGAIITLAITMARHAPLDSYALW